MDDIPLLPLLLLFIFFVLPALRARRSRTDTRRRRMSRPAGPPGQVPGSRPPSTPPATRPRERVDRSRQPAGRSQEAVAWATPSEGDVRSPDVVAPRRAAPDVAAPRPAPRLPMLSTRAGRRRAILMQEILGPPKGLRGSGSPDGNRTPMDGV